LWQERDRHNGLKSRGEHVAVGTVDQDQARDPLWKARGEIQRHLDAHTPAYERCALDSLRIEDSSNVFNMMDDRETTPRLRRGGGEEPSEIPRDKPVLSPERLDRSRPRVESSAQAVRKNERLVARAHNLVSDARSVAGDEPALLVRRPPIDDAI